MITTLLTQPTVWTESADDIPELLEEIDAGLPDVVILILPRGMASPRNLGYLSDIVNKIDKLGYLVGHRELVVGTKKQRVIIGHHKETGRRPVWTDDFGQLVLANQGV